ncbi:hypothetical protein HDU78_011499, partial [Chytriomyces hyalinus]
MSTRCDECSRDFPHPRALTQHFKSATIHIGCYCDDCNRIFIHPAALQQHYNMSSAHRSRVTSPIEFLNELYGAGGALNTRELSFLCLVTLAATPNPIILSAMSA